MDFTHSFVRFPSALVIVHFCTYLFNRFRFLIQYSLLIYVSEHLMEYHPEDFQHNDNVNDVGDGKR